jgi:hypothetical protein
MEGSSAIGRKTDVPVISKATPLERCRWDFFVREYTRDLIAALETDDTIEDIATYRQY